MKISELLPEAIVKTVLRVIPRDILVSKNWQKTWQKAREGFPGVDQELADFYLDKIWFDPPQPYGKKDGPLGGSIHKLKGFSHVHMHFGKVVVIYKVEANTLKMYVAGDHKIVETGGLTRLSDTVTQLDTMAWSQIEAPERLVKLGVEEDPELAEAAQEWMELMDSDPETRKSLRRFAQDIQNYWQLVPYLALDPRLEPLQVDVLHKLAVTHTQ